MTVARVKQVYRVLSQTSITYLSVGEGAYLRDYHDNVLELLDEGRWSVTPARDPGEPVPT